ncbi:MAG: glycyl-radical enzyme activating protein [Anaerolineales bacterium]
MTTGLILNTQRLSTEDGPGIRSTVFFKGCPLRCTWCHNPESISARIQTQWFEVRCLGCQSCIEACPNGCLSMTDKTLYINREKCQACGKCAEACPSGALGIIGKTIHADELLAELLKDRVFYEKSGGGVTLSGGEPTFQPDFAESLLRGLQEQGISTAIDTCGLTTIHTLDRLLPYTDLVLFDLKLFDPHLHFEFTGASNNKILENLSYLRDYRRAQTLPFGIWIRTPLIPGATMSDKNLNSIGQYLGETLNGSISRWELCAFNNLCLAQYQRLGMKWAFAQTPLMTSGELARCKEIAMNAGLHPDLVFATGVTREMDLN